MSRDRKLMAEIGRTMKKIDEGIDTFDTLYDKVYAAETQSQKLKYEGDLKKEIKKLQRLRDSIKTWASNSDIKDKTDLNRYRKTIEGKMEQFKVCEKETKTKAYSKEGLAKARKLTPEELATKKTRKWVTGFVDDLKSQIEECEADLETAVAEGSGKKKKGKKKQVVKSEEEEELEERLEELKFHMSSLEKIDRLLDNDKLVPEEVDEIKEDVEYYVTENTDDDFMNDDEIYETLELEAKIAALSGKGKKIAANSSKSTSKSSSNNSDSPTKKSSSKKVAAIGSLGIGRGVSKKQAKENLLKIKAEEEKKQLAAQEKAKKLEASKAAAKATQQQAQLIAQQKASQIAAQQKAAQIAAQQKAAQAAAQQKAAQIAASQQKQSATSTQQQRGGVNKNVNNNNSNSSSSNNNNGNSNSSNSNSNNVIGGGNNARQQAAQQQQLQQQQQQQQQQQNGGDTKNNANSANQGLNQQHVDKSTSIVPHAMTHHLLDAALSKLPMPSDSQRVGNLRHQARNPFNTPTVFPQEPSTVIHRQDLYAKLDVDTLFFIFYFQQGSYQQYLAASQLKKQSWRYHKKYKTWFQRHEEPTETTEEYERGTYVYFDFESGWCQRIKTEFTFEYAFLEDDLKAAIANVAAATPAPPAVVPNGSMSTPGPQ